MADEERAHHVTLALDHDYTFVARFDDVDGTPELRFDEPPPLGGSSAPCAAAVLGAAVGNCLSASLAFCLRRARVEVRGLEARVTTHVGRGEGGRLRIERIDVDLAPDLVDPGNRRERCEALFEDFCTVTASVRRGIPVSVSVKDAKGEPAYR